MDIQTSIVMMGVLAGVWGVTTWFIYRRARAGMPLFRRPDGPSQATTMDAMEHEPAPGPDARP